MKHIRGPQNYDYGYHALTTMDNKVTLKLRATSIAAFTDSTTALLPRAAIARLKLLPSAFVMLKSTRSMRVISAVLR